MRGPPLRVKWIVRGLLVLVVIGSFGASAALTANYEPPEIQAGAVENPANGTTYVTVQGFHFQGEGSKKTRPTRRGRAQRPARMDLQCLKTWSELVL